MPKRQNLNVKVDFLDIVFDTVTVEEALYMLNIPRRLFSVGKGSVPYKDHTTLYQFGDIKLYGNPPRTEQNPRGLGAYLALGGRGCDELQQFVGGFGLFFQRLIRVLGEKSFHVTRLDIAIDDFNDKPFFRVESLIKKCDRGEFISVCKKHELRKSVDKDIIGRTLYIGVGKSQIKFRFYDKDMERLAKKKKLPEHIKSWKRSEIQLRRDKAHKFALFIRDKSLEECTCGLLKESLRFVVRDKNQKNKSRWKTCQFWERFLGSVKPIHLKIEKEDSDLLSTQEWLQFGGALSAVRALLFLQGNDALGGLKEVETMLNKASYSPELAHKMASHLQEIGRTDLIPYVYEDARKIANLEEKEVE